VEKKLIQGKREVVRHRSQGGLARADEILTHSQRMTGLRVVGVVESLDGIRFDH
jgi:hypothetical protein